MSFFSIFRFSLTNTTGIMMNNPNWSRRKFLIVVILLWCRIIGEQIIGVNCNINRIHNILVRNSFPCAINSLCMCTNAGNGTHSYKISCHDVWFFKFTGELFISSYFENIFYSFSKHFLKMKEKHRIFRTKNFHKSDFGSVMMNKIFFWNVLHHKILILQKNVLDGCAIKTTAFFLSGIQMKFSWKIHFNETFPGQKEEEKITWEIGLKFLYTRHIWIWWLKMWFVRP